MSRSTRLDDTTQPEPPYSLVGVDLPKLLRQVAAGGVSPQQAEAQLQVANQLWVRLLRAIIIGVVGLVFLVVGLFLLRYAWQTNAESRQFDGHSRQTTGTVVALNRHDFRHSRSTYAPVFTYQVAGNEYRVSSDLYTGPAGYSVGETVTVRYDPAKPEAGKLSSFTDRWLLLLIAAGVGVLLTVIGLFVLTNALPKRGHAGPTSTQFRALMTQLAAGGLTVEEAHAQLQPEQGAARTRRSPVLLVLSLLLLGVALFFSLRQLVQSARLIVAGQRIEGRVIRFVHSKGSGAAPLIRYRVAGQDYECIGSYSTSVDQQPGDPVTVLYNPDQPAEAEVRSFGQLVSGPLFGLLITLLIGGLVVGLPLYRRYRARTNNM